MKKVVFFIVLLLLATGLSSSFAQQKQRVEPIKKNTATTTAKSSDALIPQGSAMIGGSVSFVSTSEDGESSYIFTFAPVAGYFVIDNLALGTSIEMLKIKDTDAIFGFGPFVRYYLNMGLFVQGKYTFQSLPFLGDRATGSAVGPAIGYAAFLNDHVSIEPVVYYNRHFGDLGEYNEFGFQIGVNAYLGR